VNSTGRSFVLLVHVVEGFEDEDDETCTTERTKTRISSHVLTSEPSQRGKSRTFDGLLDLLHEVW
jgi:hypothetical protein